jgi:hypothetical protein
MSGTIDHANLLLKLNSQGLKAFGFGTSDDPVLKDYSQTFANGTGANQASQQWHSLARVLTASASETLALTGALTNAFGVTLTFTAIKVLVVHAAAANTNDVVLGANGANGWVGMFVGTADSLKVKPGGTVIWVAPASGGAVVASDVLKVTNGSSGSSVTYDVFVLGTD